MDTTQLPHDLLGLSAAVRLLGLRHGFDADHMAGMLVTDGLNGWWITGLQRRSDRAALAASRRVGWAVVAVSLFTAGLGLAERLSNNGFGLSELLPGALIVGLLLVAFAPTGPAARTGAAREGV